MIHCNAVANADSAKFDRSAACHVNPGFYSFNNFVQMDMARNNCIGWINNTN